MPGNNNCHNQLNSLLDLKIAFEEVSQLNDCLNSNGDKLIFCCKQFAEQLRMFKAQLVSNFTDS